MLNYEYDVALSFAGEDRAHAEALAELLREDEYRVFYDEYERAGLWGVNLYNHLSSVYRDKARYCVMFLSEHYALNLWTNRERESAQERAFRESEEYILPIRIDDTEIPGISSTVGYLDLREMSITEIYRLLVEKLTGERSVSTTDSAQREINYWTQRILIDPDNAEPYFGRGRAKAGSGQYVEAIADYDKAIRIKPDFAEAYTSRGLAKVEREQYEEALVDYDKAIDLQSDLWQAYYNRGAARMMLSQHRPALNDFSRAIELKPDDAEVYNSLGLVRNILGCPEAAIGDFDKAIELDPNHVRAYTTRGLAKDRLGRLQEAKADLEKASELAEQQGLTDLRDLAEAFLYEIESRGRS